LSLVELSDFHLEKGSSCCSNGYVDEEDNPKFCRFDAAIKPPNFGVGCRARWASRPLQAFRTNWTFITNWTFLSRRTWSAFQPCISSTTRRSLAAPASTLVRTVDIVLHTWIIGSPFAFSLWLSAHERRIRTAHEGAEPLSAA